MAADDDTPEVEEAPEGGDGTYTWGVDEVPGSVEIIVEGRSGEWRGTGRYKPILAATPHEVLAEVVARVDEAYGRLDDSRNVLRVALGELTPRRGEHATAAAVLRGRPRTSLRSSQRRWATWRPTPDRCSTSSHLCGTEPVA